MQPGGGLNLISCTTEPIFIDGVNWLLMQNFYKVFFELVEMLGICTDFKNHIGKSEETVEVQLMKQYNTRNPICLNGYSEPQASSGFPK